MTTKFKIQVGKVLEVGVADDNYLTALQIARNRFDDQFTDGKMHLSATVVPSSSVVLHFLNSDKRPFIARIVRKGDNYGLNFGLVHGEGQDTLDWKGEQKDEWCFEPLIEFYDASFPNLGPFGQFISRYYVMTLMDPKEPKLGLCLQGGMPVWSIDKDAMDLVRAWVNNQFPGVVWKEKFF